MSELWENFKGLIIFVIVVWKNEWAEKIFEEIMVEKF